MLIHSRARLSHKIRHHSMGPKRCCRPAHWQRIWLPVFLAAWIVLLSPLRDWAQQAPNVEGQVAELVGQMTLDEKVGQMTQADSLALKDRSDIQKYFIGSVLSGGGHGPADL